MRKIYEETCCKGKRKKKAQNDEEDSNKKRKASENGFCTTRILQKAEKCEETSDEKVPIKFETDVKAEVSQTASQDSVNDNGLCSNHVLPKIEKSES